jgi:delta24(24(1))-sterol reductase
MVATREAKRRESLTSEPTATAEAVAYGGINNASSGKIEYEFGGPIGATALMIWSHYILLYFWYCLETNSGQMVIPGFSTESVMGHFDSFYTLFLTKGIPSTTTWVAYAVFFFLQLGLAQVMPGITMYGLPTAPHGVRLPYHCNGYLCYYATLAVFVGGQYSGLFPMSSLAKNYGEYLIASIVIGDVTSVLWYVYGLLFADQYNGRSQVTGNIVYDFFMGTILYPRFGELDIKMIAEARWSWTTLFLLTASAAALQYEERGYISPNIFILLTAHWLYSNACAKGEHCIPCTWDMFHENFGWMLNFWNITGVPFLYCFQSLYVVRNQDSIDAFGYPLVLSAAVFVLLIVGYYIFDTANCQKATIKIRIKRNTFPQLPWAILEEPIAYIHTPKGNLLIGGWYAFARKMQYTGDILMALSWGLACGFESSLPYFYALFFTCMILHRQSRDEIRCSQKYGEHWKIYTDKVPNVFIPSAAFFKWILGIAPHPYDEVSSPKGLLSVDAPTSVEKVVIKTEAVIKSPKPQSTSSKSPKPKSRSSTPTPAPVSVSSKSTTKSRASSRSRATARSDTPSRKTKASPARDRPIEIMKTPRVRKPVDKFEF